MPGFQLQEQSLRRWFILSVRRCWRCRCFMLWWSWNVDFDAMTVGTASYRHPNQAFRCQSVNYKFVLSRWFFLRKHQSKRVFYSTESTENRTVVLLTINLVTSFDRRWNLTYARAMHLRVAWWPLATGQNLIFLSFELVSLSQQI